MRRLILSAILVLMTSPAWAQSPFETLQTYRADYPTPMSKAQVGELLNRVAWTWRDNGWGVLGKESGNNCPTPQNVLISCDYLVRFVSEGVYVGRDVLIDEDGDGTPTWGGENDMSELIASGARSFVAPTGTVEPTPTPPPPSNLEARVASLEAQVEELRQHAGLLQVTINTLAANFDARILTLERREIPMRCTASVFGIPISCRLEQ